MTVILLYSMQIKYNLFRLAILLCIISIESKATTTSTLITQSIPTTTEETPINMETTVTAKSLGKDKLNQQKNVIKLLFCYLFSHNCI